MPKPESIGKKHPTGGHPVDLGRLGKRAAIAARVLPSPIVDPANDMLHVPNLTEGCTCNFAPARVACVPTGEFRRSGAASQEVTTTRANGYLFFSFFSCFSFRFSSGVRWAFFCAAFLSLSLLPLSPIFGSPCFGLRNVVDHIAAMIVGRAEAKSNQGESRKQPNSERTGKDAAGTKRGKTDHSDGVQFLADLPLGLV